MRTSFSPTLVVLAVFAFAHAANAQETVLFKAPQFPSRVTIGGDIVMLQPKGDFASNIGRGGGLNGTALIRLDERGYLQFRFDAGGAEYGDETKKIPFNPITGRVSFKVETSNTIAWAGLGGQLQIPDGPFRPYVNGSVAYTDFRTESTLEGLDNVVGDLSTTNQHDGSHAWIYGAGVNIPFGKKFTSGMLNIGARYYRGAEARYLKRGDITDNPDGTISFTPRRSKTDMILWQLGASFTLPRK